MKTIFDNKQVCHVWASQTQSHGSNAGKSIYFRDSTIYSYGQHFPMAKIYNGFALVNSERYSVTTAKQLGNVRSALVDRMAMLHVPEPQELMHPNNEEYFLDEIGIQLELIFKSRSTNIRDINHIIGLLNKLYHYQGSRKFFQLDDDTYQVCDELIEKAIDRDKVKRQIAEVKQAKKDEILKEYYAKLVPLWVKNKVDEHIPERFFPFDMVRIKGNEVETSRGARVPLERAKQLLGLIALNLPITGLKVGSFEIESEIENDFIKIGCHKINLTQTREALRG